MLHVHLKEHVISFFLFYWIESSISIKCIWSHMWLCFNINFLFRWSDIGVSVRLQPLCYCSVTKLCLTPSLSPGACSNTSPLSRWCHPNISSSIVQLSSCPQSFPASQSFPLNRLFASGDQSTGASASASVLPINIKDWFLLGLTCWISLLSQGHWGVFSSKTVWNHQFFVFSFLYDPTLTFIHDYWKNYRSDYKDLCQQSDVSAF